VGAATVKADTTQGTSERQTGTSATVSPKGVTPVQKHRQAPKSLHILPNHHPISYLPKKNRWQMSYGQSSILNTMDKYPERARTPAHPPLPAFSAPPSNSLILAILHATPVESTAWVYLPPSNSLISLRFSPRYYPGGEWQSHFRTELRTPEFPG